jgi:hypothetical protein
LLVVVDSGAVIAGARLDRLADADALADRPDEAARFDLGATLRDFALAPDLALIHVMQRADDSDRPGLSHIIQADRIVRPEPAPRLQHISPCHSPRSRSERSGI